MSRADRAPAAGSSGPARWLRIADNSHYTRTQRAYRAYIDHGRDCTSCAVDSLLCPAAEQLWGAYQAATRSS
ncbi:hypothetical protein [Streptomyces sp. NPDC003710]